MATATVILFKAPGKYYTTDEWEIPEGDPYAFLPSCMKNSPDFTRVGGNGAVLVPTQEPWGYPHLFPGES
jgi:hypothetical protein